MRYELMHSRYAEGRDRRRGSVLLTAVIFAFMVMALMGSYLYLSSGEYRIASRSFLLNASFNLAEGGIDLGLNRLYKRGVSGWSSGTDSSGRSYWARSFSNYEMGSGITGKINVVILDPSSDTPEIYAEGVAEGHVAGAMKKQLYADLSSGLFPFQNGFNTKDGILLKGNNVTFDSYDSRNGSYGLSNVNSEITISTTSVEVDAIDIGNADIYGYVATGGSMPNVGPSGSITDYSNPGDVNYSRVTTDYYAEFPDIDPPTLSSPYTSMPTSGTISGGEYLLTNWSSNSSTPLVIDGDTTIVITGDMKLSGNGAIEINPGASLTIYAEGNVSLGGNGVLNTSTNPQQLMIFGTNDTVGAQSIDISGNGYLAAAVYAPNSAVSMNGGGTSGRIFGAVAAYDANLVGNSHFSYDEALSDYDIGGGGYHVEEWVELSGVGLASSALDMADYGL